MDWEILYNADRNNERLSERRVARRGSEVAELDETGVNLNGSE